MTLYVDLASPDAAVDVLDNPVGSQWETLGRLRESLEGLKGVPGDIEYLPVMVKKRKDKKTGKSVSYVEGGPYIGFREKISITTAAGGEQESVRSKLFTWTSKMSCPSFSLPAGPPKLGGTCPASTADVVEREGSYREFHQPMPAGSAYICDLCYAGKNNYIRYKQVTLNQLIHRWWTDREVKAGRFVRKMSEAIAALAFDEKVAKVLAAKDVSAKYFRIHDSGDFHTVEYYRAWVDVCHNLPEVHFWAPTRQWVFTRWRAALDAYPPPKNLALRPSALFLGAKPPKIDGLAAGTTSVEGRMPRPIWNCPAYEAEDETSCAAARCRRCWTSQKVDVNYLTH